MISPRYTVVWLPGIEKGLTTYWVRADSAERERITKVVHLIDRVLSMAPERQGSPDALEPDVRLWEVLDFPPCVRVAFRLSAEGRLVRVIRLSFYRTPAD